MSQDQQSLAIRANIWTLYLSRNWLKILLTILGVWVILPFAAPVMMQAGLEQPARMIYTVYSPFCHQFAFRSFFLLGEQPVYPRENAGSNWGTFEDYVSELPEFQGIDIDSFDLPLMSSARGFLGNDRMGYKVTLCERDIMIYMALFGGGLVYAIPVVRRRLRPVPLWLYVFLGLGPIGLDGFSQLLGYPPFSLWPPRETLPEFRVITGIIFGLMNAWLAFPYFEAAMQDTQYQIQAKLYRAGVVLPFVD